MQLSNVHTDDTKDYGITYVRQLYVDGLEATVDDGNGNQIPNPAKAMTDQDYLLMRIGDLVSNYAHQADMAGVVNPNPPVVKVNGVVMSVTRKQGLKALLRANEPSIGMAAPILESQITATIMSLAEDTPAHLQLKYDTLYEFQNAKTWVYDNAFTAQLQQMLGMTDAQKRALFDLAATYVE